MQAFIWTNLHIFIKENDFTSVICQIIAYIFTQCYVENATRLVNQQELRPPRMNVRQLGHINWIVCNSGSLVCVCVCVCLCLNAGIYPPGLYIPMWWQT